MKASLPKIDLERDNLERILLISAWGLVFIMFLLALIYYGELPTEIPSHYNFKGEVDNYSNKAFLFLLPSISLLITAGFQILIKFPHKFNYPVKFSEDKTVYQYRLSIKTLLFIGLQTNIMFALITVQTILSGLGISLNLTLVIVLLMIVMEMATIITYFVKASAGKK